MKLIFKIYKILTTIWFLLLILGFIFPTYIRENIIYIYQTLLSSGDAGLQSGITFLFISLLIFWFAPKTLWKFISTKGKIKNFWNEL
jgi:hypothetical protein